MFIYLILFAILITIILLINSISKRNKRSVIFLSLSLFILVVPIIILSAAFSLPNIKVKDLGDFRKEIRNKYDYVKQVEDSNYRSMYYKVIIGTTKDLNWEEMKGIYIDTREFLLSDSTQDSLKQFCDKKYKGNSPFFKVEIEFDFNTDGIFDVKIEGPLDDEMYSEPWRYWNYEDTSFEISPGGEIV